MQIAIVGLGRMGAGISQRLMRHGHQVVGWDASAEATKKIADAGATAATSLEDVVNPLTVVAKPDGGVSAAAA